MRSGSIIRLVAGREISERLQGRLIRVMTIVTALFVVAAITIPSLVKGSSTPTTIGLVGPAAQALAPALERTASAAKAKVTVSDVADDAVARSELNNGRLDVALSVGAGSARAEVEESLSPTIRGVLAATVDEVHLREALAARSGAAHDLCAQAPTV